jgi:hypothetical protein
MNSNPSETEASWTKFLHKRLIDPAIPRPQKLNSNHILLETAAPLSDNAMVALSAAVP